MNKKGHHDIGTGKNIIVGLLFIAALLFVCIKAAWPDKDTSVLMTMLEDNEEPVVQEEVVVDEPEEEPEVNLVDPDKPMIALTFDDGPSKYTDALLDKLEECNGRASFFVLGSNVPKYPETIKRMEKLGCEIGNHTYSHADLTDLEPEQMQAEIESTNQALTDVLGYSAKLVRPTYGALNDTVKASLAYPFAMWSVDTTDWQRDDAASVVNYVLETVQDGDVILLHDIHQTTVEAMLTLIPELQARGYQLVTFSEMAELRGVSFVNGEKYFKFRR